MVTGFKDPARVVPLGARPRLGRTGNLTGTGAVVICGDGTVAPPMLPAAVSSSSMGTGISAGTTASVGAVTSMLAVLVGSAESTATGGGGAADAEVPDQLGECSAQLSRERNRRATKMLWLPSAHAWKTLKTQAPTAQGLLPSGSSGKASCFEKVVSWGFIASEHAR